MRTSNLPMPTCKENLVTCKLCGSNTCLNYGEILHPSSSMVARQSVELTHQEYYLMACQNCGFQFKFPDISAEKLDACYSAADKEVYGTKVVSDEYRKYRRVDFIEELINKHTHGNKILDVGCSDGSMLAHFSGTWDKYGLEIGEAAATKAASRNIHILGKTLEEVDSNQHQFDVVVSFDVIEHILNPLDFFFRAKKMLKPGGLILTVTGDTSSTPWRFLGSLTWYCTLVEHVSFFNHDSMLWVSNHLEMEELEYHLLPHHRSGWKLIFRDLCAFSAYRTGRACYGFGIPAIQRKLNRGAPSWLSAHDHLFHVMQLRVIFSFKKPRSRSVSFTSKNRVDGFFIMSF